MTVHEQRRHGTRLTAKAVSLSYVPPNITELTIQRQAMLKSLDISFFVSQAERLRPGHTCLGPSILEADSINTFVHGTNVNILLTFDDGIRWMTRIRQQRQLDPPKPIARVVLESEAATFIALNLAGLSVPRAVMPVTDEGGCSPLP